MTPEPKCGKCGEPISVKQNVILPKGGGVEHVDCHKSNQAPVTRCGLCRTPIRAGASSRTMQGVTYHVGCWDRKMRSGK